MKNTWLLQFLYTQSESTFTWIVLKSNFHFKKRRQEPYSCVFENRKTKPFNSFLLWIFFLNRAYWGYWCVIKKRVFFLNLSRCSMIWGLRCWHAELRGLCPVLFMWSMYNALRLISIAITRGNFICGQILQLNKFQNFRAFAFVICLWKIKTRCHSLPRWTSTLKSLMSFWIQIGFKVDRRKEHSVTTSNHLCVSLFYALCHIVPKSFGSMSLCLGIASQ